MGQEEDKFDIMLCKIIRSLEYILNPGLLPVILRKIFIGVGVIGIVLIVVGYSLENSNVTFFGMVIAAPLIIYVVLGIAIYTISVFIFIGFMVLSNYISANGISIGRARLITLAIYVFIIIIFVVSAFE